MVEISLPLGVEVAYDWILIIIQLYFIGLHCIRLRIQYQKANTAKKKVMFKEIDSRTLSIGILLFALFVVFNRFFGIIGVYGTSLKSCDLYLTLAVIYSVIHKTFNYQFILFRLKSQLKSADSSQTSSKLKWIGFYIFSVIIILFEIYFIINVFLQDPLSEIDDNRCNFSPIALKKFVPLYGGADLLFSVILLFFFGFGLWKYRKIEMNATRKSVKKTLNRILTWSLIAICSTFISTIIAAIIDGASPIFLVGDTVINSICAVMQFAPINKNLDKTYKEQWNIFIIAIKKSFNVETTTTTSSPNGSKSDGQRSGHSGTASTNFGIKGNLRSKEEVNNIDIVECGNDDDADSPNDIESV